MFSAQLELLPWVQKGDKNFYNEALAGLSGTLMNTLVVTAVAYPVIGLVVLAGIDVWEWWTNRGSIMRETYVYRGGNGARYED